MSVCLCVCDRDRERAREREGFGSGGGDPGGEGSDLVLVGIQPLEHLQLSDAIRDRRDFVIRHVQHLPPGRANPFNTSLYLI